MVKEKYKEENVRKAVEGSLSISEVCRQLGLIPVGGNHNTVKKYIKKYNIDISHFTGQGWNVGLKFKPYKQYSLDEILIEDSTYNNTSAIRKRLFEEGLKEEVCEKCGNTMWMNEKMPLELHHINGINNDNRISNLQILCANCHAQISNHKGKNTIDKIKFKEYKDYKRGEIKPIVEFKIKKKCEICGNEVKNNNNKYCSYNCLYKHNKKNIPNISELKDKLNEIKSFVGVGKYYGVSDNAVRKWCKYYGLPYRKKDMVHPKEIKNCKHCAKELSENTKGNECIKCIRRQTITKNKLKMLSIKHNWNRHKIANELNLSESYIRKLWKKYGLK